jgi:hypothetical protein
VYQTRPPQTDTGYFLDMEGVNDAPIGRNTESRLFYRFRDLKAMGIVGSWPTLLRWSEANSPAESG